MSLYRALFRLLTPLWLGYTLWQAARHREPRYLAQRLGLFRRPEPADLWLHAASVGEVNAALPLLRLLRTHHPEMRMLLTTWTLAGARTVGERLPGVGHVYLPIDWPGAVSRFLDTHSPRAGIVMETELWPELYRACSARGLPLVIVNGRLSARTLGAVPWLRRLFGQALASTRCVLARDEADRLGFVRMGTPADRCRAIGNIKFAGLTAATPAPTGLGRPYLLAASTRAGEETLLLEAWRRVQDEERLLVIAPRHPQRRRAILRELGRRDARVAVRSRGERPTPGTEVYLADTLGELPGFIAGADLVIMGGSLLPRGGQNLLEPAALGRAILVGPHMDNFRSETALLLRHDAVRQVTSSEELAPAIGELLARPELRAAMGARARACVAAEADVTERYLSALEECLPELFSATRGPVS
jgi:3-deoxy-D-manno-octulosonic-acid transferase